MWNTLSPSQLTQPAFPKFFFGSSTLCLELRRGVWSGSQRQGGVTEQIVAEEVEVYDLPCFQIFQVGIQVL